MSEPLSFSFSDGKADLHCFGRSAGAALVLGRDAARHGEAGEVREADGRFEVAIAGVCEAVLEPLGAPIEPPHGARRDWLCRVRGTRGGGDELDGLGCVSAAPAGLGELALRRSVWIGVGEELAFTLVGERPHAGGGHGDERIAAFVARGAPLEADAIADPRLSSSYAEDGRLLRAGLELWEEAPGDDASTHDRARALRIGGETIAAGELAASDGRATSVAFLRWHYDGREGRGCYVIERAA